MGPLLFIIAAALTSLLIYTVIKTFEVINRHQNKGYDRNRTMQQRYHNLFRRMGIPKSIPIIYQGKGHHVLWDFEKNKIVDEQNFYFKDGEKVVTSIYVGVKEERHTIESLRKEIISRGVPVIIYTNEDFSYSADSYFTIYIGFAEKKEAVLNRLKGTFMYNLITGSAKEDEIHDYIDKWYENYQGKRNLAEYLGMKQIDFER